MRWQLSGSAPFLTDPGIIPLTSQFTNRIARSGFPVVKEMAQPEHIAGAAVTRRYFPSANLTFPLVQIGPGVFASNQSTEYDWKSFKKQTLSALKVLLASYPQLDGLPLTPVHLELRYIDAFDESLLDTADVVKFANKGTELSVELPSFLSDKRRFTGETLGRIGFHKRLVKPAAMFTFDLASAQREKTRIVRLESKVISLRDDVPRLKNTSTFVARVSEWLEQSHKVTSPFFREFLKQDLMKMFGANA